MTTGLQLFSTIKSSSELEISMLEVEVPEPKAGEVVVKMGAAPINPSDMWPMFGLADLSSASLSEDGRRLTAPVPEQMLMAHKPRLDMVLPIGNEGAGEVVATGEGAEQLLGKTVAVMSGACYAQYCVVPAHSCLPHADGTTDTQAAASFVNPLTALCMVETMKLEGHTALVHTAAASNLGQMLNRICLADDVPLVNIVRKQEQVDLLKGQGAKLVVNSSADTYRQDLYKAIAETGATLAFDATGGGELASDILATMEAYLSRDARGLHTYGSEQLKQVYLYGGLDINPTVLRRAYGMTWAVGGWLLPRFMAKLGMEKAGALQARVAAEITTTFASHFTRELSLAEVLSPVEIGEYNAKKTGEKFLVRPNG
jgi:NADPH:quinone reductase-like Zn-dependent oxidoreductase